MSEGISGRVGRIISGGFNALIDAVENLAPETVMEEAIREIDGALNDVRVELGRVIANKHLASKRIAEENNKHDAMIDKLELAIKEGRDDLASAVIAKQLDIEAQIPVLERSVLESAEKEKELEGYILALQAKRREMQEELRDYRESRKDMNESCSPDALTNGNGKADSTASKVARASSAFERVIEKQTGIEAGRAKPDAEQARKLSELEKISRKNRIEERLLEAKSSLKPKTN
jgi:phage shock protein A